MRKLGYLLLVLFAAAISTPAKASTSDTSHPSYEGLWLSTPFPAFGISADQPITVKLTIHNKGLPPERVNLSVSQMPKDWQSIFFGNGRPVQSVFVGPDSTADLTLRLLPPNGVKKGTYHVVLAAAGTDGKFQLPLDVSFDSVMPAKLTLDTEIASLKGTPTSSFDYNVTLHNDSGRTAVAQLDSTAPDGFQVTFKKQYGTQELTSVRLKPGASQGMKVSVKPQPHVSAGDYQVGVRAVAGKESAQATLALDVTGQPDLSLTGPNDKLSGDAEAGKETPITLMVTNRGTAAAHNVKISAYDPSGWKIDFAPKTIATLPAGGQQQVKALVTPSSQAIAGDYMVTMRASGNGTSTSSDYRVTVETSTMWGIVGVLVIAAAVVVLSLAVVRFGRR